MTRIIAGLSLLWGIGLGGLCMAQPATRPTGIDAALCPPSWERSVVFYQSYDSPDGRPEVNAPGLTLRDGAMPRAGGMHGRCGAPASGKTAALHLASDGLALSPHRPLSISFWWALAEDLPRQGSFNLVQLNGRGFIAHFARGGPWCGLKQTAGAAQIYYLPGIANVNGIYDQALHESLGLKAGQWHHTAMVISAASLVSVYTDGELVFESRTAGRPFSAEDGFRSVTIGGGLLLDELAILSRPLTADELREYALAMRQVREAHAPASGL